MSLCFVKSKFREFQQIRLRKCTIIGKWEENLKFWSVKFLPLDAWICTLVSCLLSCHSRVKISQRSPTKYTLLLKTILDQQKHTILPSQCKVWYQNEVLEWFYLLLPNSVHWRLTISLRRPACFAPLLPDSVSDPHLANMAIEKNAHKYLPELWPRNSWRVRCTETLVC